MYPMHPHHNPGIERRFILSITITSVIFFAELIGGFWTGSLSLLSDSAHVFMDIFALVLSFVALRLSAMPADDRHSYGYHRLEVLAALANGLTLVVIALGIFWESVDRFQNPQSIRSTEMLIIAAIGLAANLAVAFILGSHSPEDGEHNHSVEDVNVHSAYLHVVGDAISSVGVIAAAILISLTGWQWLDALVSVLIGVLIAFSAYRVTRKALHILIEGVPEGLSLKRIQGAMNDIAGVTGVHDLHVWNICSGHVALSAHLTLVDFSGDHLALRERIRTVLVEHFHIEHTTLQFEAETCGQGLTGCGTPDALL
jgi:cobalt-zinc-cadmium efflux system protein